MPDEIEATGARHFKVRDHQIYGCGIKDIDCFRHTGGSKHLVALKGQIPLEHLQCRRSIIDNQDPIFLKGVDHWRCFLASPVTLSMEVGSRIGSPDSRYSPR